MLRGMRKASSNWLGRIVMGVVLGLIAISFAIWGIGDIFRGFGQSTVAKIGSTEITVDQFRQIYNDRLQQLGRQLGRPITPDQARALRLDQQLLGQLVAEAALDQRARQLRLNLSDAEIARQITENPTFRGPTGQFDRARFEQMLRNAGFTEPRFIAEQKPRRAAPQIVETVGGDACVPKTALEALNRYENEQRAIDYVVLDRRRPATSPRRRRRRLRNTSTSTRRRSARPSTARSRSWCCGRRSWRRGWRSPTPTREAYEDRKSRFGTPERRQLEQIVFPTVEEAQAAAARLPAARVSRRSPRSAASRRRTSTSASSPRPASSTARSPTRPSR